MFFSSCFLFFVLKIIQTSKTKYFSNPICKDGADPWVIKIQDYYYYCPTGGSFIHLSKTNALEDLETSKIVFSFAPSNSSYNKNLWAPAGDGPIPSQRMHVLECKGENPDDGFVYKAKLNLPENKYSIDGTVLKVDEKRFFVWSGWDTPTTKQQNLYIAEMENGYSVKTKQRIIISSPEYDWEKRSGKINEGPEQLNSPNGNIYIIYSAPGVSDYYSLGQLELINKSDPMNPNSWKKKENPVFKPTDKVFGVGHASFTISPSGKENWIVYHSAKSKGSGFSRHINIQKFVWDGQEVNFGIPWDPLVNHTCPQ